MRERLQALTATLLLLAVVLHGASAAGAAATDRWGAANGAALAGVSSELAGSALAVGRPVADQDEEDGITRDDDGERGDGPQNVVRLRNRVDGRLRIRGNVQLNRILGENVTPVNRAEAYGSCTDCQTISVALQLNLVSRTASNVVPRNTAEALNVECLRCRTIGRAIQYVISVDDPRGEAREVRDLIDEMDRELRRIHSESNRIDLAEADQRISAVIARFTALAQSLDDQRAEDAGPGATGTPTSATASPQPTGAATGEPTPASSSAAPADAPTPTVPRETPPPQATVPTEIVVTPAQTGMPSPTVPRETPPPQATVPPEVIVTPTPGALAPDTAEPTAAPNPAPPADAPTPAVASTDATPVAGGTADPAQPAPGAAPTSAP